MYTNNKYATVLVPLLYALILASLPIDAFLDRVGYLDYANNSAAIAFISWNKGILSFITNEPLWLLFNVISSFLFSAENTVRVFIFIGAFLVAFNVVKFGKINIFFVILILLLPQVLKNHTTHLRQGVAIGIFLFAFSSSSSRKNLILLVTPFIHSSFVFVLLVYFFSKFISELSFFKRRLSSSLLLLSFLGCVSIFLVLFPLLLSISGARQAEEYADAVVEGSGFGFIIWFVFILIFILQRSEWKRQFLFPVNMVFFYLATYFVFPVSARIFESVLMIVLFAVFSLKSTSKNIAVGLFCMLFVFQWVIKFSTGLVF